MDPRLRAMLRLGVLVAVVAALLILFPAVFRFAEGAARSVVRLWWLILLAGLGVWLVWGVGQRPK
ncbi:MAG: hypothetical protein HY735_24720 [Verrucomicrobia bacterium]|nr:hypothetical protein [Verrucomicrobiota bacterium]